MPDRSKSTRREFLKGHAAIDALSVKLPMSVDSRSPADFVTSVERQNSYFEHYSKKAMACDFELLFNMQQYAQSGNVTMLVFNLIDQLEDQLSVYRDHSEVSQLNARAANQPIEIEAHLFRLLQLASSIHEQTKGAFDITAMPLSSIWGFDRRNGRLPNREDIERALELVGMSHVTLCSKNSTMQFSRPGLSINLGGIGKGHSLDRAVELIEANDVHDFILHGGQSSVVARGSQNSNDQSQPGWQVGLSHPLTPDQRIAELTLRNEALGTSGTGRQGFFVEGKRYGHIIDPRTGWPTDHFLSTTVISPSAALSDALATAFFVMPLAEVESFCRENVNVKAICVSAGKAGQTELNWFNLVEEDWQRL